MQLGLRAIKYVNTDQNPSITPRIITTSVVDVANETGVTATTTINIVPVNDAPVVGGNLAATLLEGGIYVFNASAANDLNSTDVDDAVPSLNYVITTVGAAVAPAHGTLFRDTNNNQIDSGEALALTSVFSQAEVTAGLIKYQHSGSDTLADSFGFKVQDGMENAVVAPTGTFAFTVTPVNDAPTASATAANPAFAENATNSANSTPVVLFTAAAVSPIETAQFVNFIRLSISGLADGAFEKLWIDGQAVALQSGSGTTTANSFGYTISLSPDGSTAIVGLSKASTAPAAWVTLLNALAYQNTSEQPTTSNRVVTLTQITDNGGGTLPDVNATTLNIASTVTLTPFDTPPTAGNNAAATVANAGVVTISATNLSTTDPDSQNALTYTVGTATSKGTLFVDANDNGIVDSGEARGATSTFTQQNIADGKLKYSHAGDPDTADSFTFTVKDVGNAALPVATFNLNINLTAAPTPGVTGGGTSTPSTGGITPLFPNVTVTPPTGETVRSVSFNVTGTQNGNHETLTFGTAPNTTTVPLVIGTSVTSGTAPNTVTYTVADNGSGGLTVTVTDNNAPGFTGPQAEALIEGMTFTNNALPPTPGTRNVTLSSVVNENSGGTTTTTVTPNIGSTVNVNTAIVPFPTPNIPPPATGTSIQTLTFGVTGVRDGANEVLLVNGQDIPLVPGTTTINGITYTVTVVGGNATVTVTNPTVPGWTEAQTETLLGNTTYVNNATPPTAGERSVTLNSVTPVDNTTSTPATPAPVTGQGTTIAPTPNTGTSTPLAGETLPTIPGTSSVDSLTFTVTGVSPATGNPSETLNIGGNVIPLMPGTSTYGTSPNQVTYTVTVVGGVATVVATPETNYPAATAQTLTQGVTYTNSATPATGPRTVSLTSLNQETGTGSPPGTVSTTPVTDVGSTLVLNNTNAPPVLTPFTLTTAEAAVPTLTGTNTIQTLTFGVTGVRDGANEVLHVNGQNIPLVPGTTIIGGVTYTVAVDGSGTATVTVTDPTAPGWSEHDAEALVSGVTYVNNATSPTSGDRGLTLTGVTQVASTTAAPVTPVTTTAATPTPVTPFTAPDNVPTPGTGHSIQTLTFGVSNVQDGSSEVLHVNGQNIPLVAGTTTIGGVIYTVTMVGNNATVTVTDPTAPGWNETDAELLVHGVTYVNTATTPTPGNRGLTFTGVTEVVSATPAATPVSSVSATGSAPASLGPFIGTDHVPTPTGSSTIQTLTFGVTGVLDGANEVLHVNGQTIPLVAGTTTIDGVIYTVTMAGNNATVTVTDPSAPGWTEVQAEALVQGVTYTNSTSTPTSGTRTLSLTSVTEDNPINTPTVTPVTTTATTPTTLTPFTATDIVPPTGSNTIQTLTFGVTGVQDGANEVFHVNGQNIPLVPGITVIGGITYTVAVDGSGNATVTVTDPMVPGGWTESQAESLVNNITYTNSATTPHTGPRTLSLTSVTEVNPTTTATPITTVSTTVAPAAGSGPTTPMATETLPAIADGSTVDSLTFRVAGVADGGSEVLTFGSAPTTTVPLVTGTTVPSATGASPAGSYAVTVVSGVATVVFTPTTNLSLADAQLLTRSTAYTNTAAPPTAGARDVSLASLMQQVGTDIPTNVPETGIGSTVLVSNNSNTAPTVSGDKVFDVNEGSVYTLTAADLAATDAQLAAGSLSFKLTAAPTQGTLFRDSNGNGLVNTGDASRNHGRQHQIPSRRQRTSG